MWHDYDFGDLLMVTHRSSNLFCHQHHQTQLYDISLHKSIQSPYLYCQMCHSLFRLLPDLHILHVLLNIWLNRIYSHWDRYNWMYRFQDFHVHSLVRRFKISVSLPDLPGIWKYWSNRTVNESLTERTFAFINRFRRINRIAIPSAMLVVTTRRVTICTPLG